MARIPTIQSSGNVRTGQVASVRASSTPKVSHASTAVFQGPGQAPQISFAGAESEAAAGRAISGGLMDLAQGVNRRIQMNEADAKQAAAKLKQKQDFDNHIWAESQYTAAQRQWMQWTSDVQQTNSEGVVSQFNEQFSKFQEDALKSAPNEDARMRLKLKLDDLGTSVFDRAIKIEAHNRVNNTINTFTQMLADTSDTVVKDPFLAGFPISELYKNLEVAHKMGRMPDEAYLKLKEQVNNLSAIQAEVAATKDPEFARMVIENAEGIDWSRRRAVLNVIERAENTNNSLFKYEQQELFKSHIDSLMETGQGATAFNPETYAASFPKEHRDAALAEVRDKVEIAKSVYVVKNEMQGKPPGELGPYLEKLRPQAGDAKFNDKQAVFQKAVELADQQVKLFNKDPFSYSRQDPVVDRAWDLVEGLPKDAKPELVHQLTQQALEASTSYQRKAGVPEGRLSAMSQGAAAQYAERINKGDTKQVQEALGQLQAVYGKYYATAFRDLVRLPEGQRVDAAAQVVAMHIGKSFLTDFIAAVRTSPADMKLDTKDAQQLRDRLVTSPELMAFKGAMLSANPGAASMVNDYHVAIEKYATSIYFRGQAKNPADAVKQATELVIGSAYGFANVDGTPVAVKRVQGTTQFTDENITRIGRGLSEAQRLIGVDRIDTSRFAFPQNISDDAKSKSIKATLQNDSFWVTNPQNDGAILYMHGAEGSTAPVKWKDGRQVEIKFTQALYRGNNPARQERPWWMPEPIITGFYPALP